MKIFFYISLFFLFMMLTGCITSNHEKLGQTSMSWGVPSIRPLTAGFNGSPGAYHP